MTRPRKNVEETGAPLSTRHEGRRHLGSRLISSRGSHQPIGAVTFDVGGTLIEPWPSVGHLYAEVASRYGTHGLSTQDLNSRFARAWRKTKEFNYTRAAWAKLVDATFSGLIPIPPSRSFFPSLYSRFTEPDAWRIYPDVAPTLQALAGLGLKLGVISNWDRRLIPLMRELELFDAFKCVVVSCHARCLKPSRSIFAQAALRLKVPAHRILHVGDSRSLDVRGARAAGLQALWLRRDEKKRLGAGQIASLLEIERHLI